MAWKRKDLLITYGGQRRERTQNLHDKKKKRVKFQGSR